MWNYEAVISIICDGSMLSWCSFNICILFSWSGFVTPSIIFQVHFLFIRILINLNSIKISSKKLVFQPHIDAQHYNLKNISNPVAPTVGQRLLFNIATAINYLWISSIAKLIGGVTSLQKLCNSTRLEIIQSFVYTCRLKTNCMLCIIYSLLFVLFIIVVFLSSVAWR